MHLVMQPDIFLDTLNPVYVLKTCSIYSAGDSTQTKSVTTMLTWWRVILTVCVYSETAQIKGTQERLMGDSIRRGHLEHYCHSVTLQALMHSLTSHRKIIIVFTVTKGLAAALLNLLTTNYYKRRDGHTRPCTLTRACIYFKVSMLSKIL